jgi:serine/threonine protein kinase
MGDLVAPETQLGAPVVGGAYQIRRLLGEGGMGRVYEARPLRRVGRLPLDAAAPMAGEASGILAKVRC